MENKLKAVRESRNISRAELAERSGVNCATIAEIESGKSVTVVLGTIKKLAGALNVSISEIA